MKPVFVTAAACLCLSPFLSAEDPSEKQLAAWLKRFPEADTNKDGSLSVAEANAYRKKLKGNRSRPSGGGGAPRTFKVDPGWEAEKFPDYAVCYKTPEQIKAIYAEQSKGPAVVSYDKPADGTLRIVGTGHSFMAPGYRTLPMICRAAGFEQPLYTHTGGGITGSTRYKWEQENGIFQFDKKPVPKLLASIANAEWDAMMWGPYFNDRPEYYSCWIDFCLQYNPGMKFYLSDAWPQLYQLETHPKTEEIFTEELIDKIGEEKRNIYIKVVQQLREKYPGKVYIMPTSDAMVLAAKYHIKHGLPGIEGIHRAVGEAEERALWRDKLGHLGPGFEWLEGYVFYSTLYGKSPELLEKEIERRGDSGFPGKELDQIFRKLAWQAVSNHELSGVTDKDGDGVGDK